MEKYAPIDSIFDILDYRIVMSRTLKVTHCIQESNPLCFCNLNLMSSQVDDAQFVDNFNHYDLLFLDSIDSGWQVSYNFHCGFEYHYNSSLDDFEFSCDQVEHFVRCC